MPRFIAFLRAINVGRGRVVNMARICEELGCDSPGLFGAISDGRPYRDRIQMIVDGKSMRKPMNHTRRQTKREAKKTPLVRK